MLIIKKTLNTIRATNVDIGNRST